MRTTIRLDDDLFRRVKALAATQGRTLGDVVEDALRQALDLSAAPAGELPPLPTVGGTGTLPGVDLNDAAGLRDLMDEGTSLNARR